jgi:hypothetical protein
MFLEPQRLIEQFDACKSDRSMFESLWQDLTEYLIPRKNDVTRSSIAGERKGATILDNTGMNSAELLAASLHSMLTSPVAFFFTMTTGIPQLDNVDAVRMWLQTTTRILHDILNNSNFQTEVHEYYLDLVTCGNGGVLVEEDAQDVVRFSARPLREVYVKENSKGRIDTIYRCYELDTRGLVDEFGLDNVPEKVREQFQAGKSQKYEVLHAIYPKNSYETGKLFKFPIISQYVLKNDKVNLSVGGYREFPLVYGRWSKLPGEAYGRGPGEKALPSVKMKNKMEETTIRGGQKVVDPPMQAPDDGFVMPLVSRPGGWNYYRAGSKDRIEPMVTNTNVDFGFQFMDSKERSIREAFYVDQMKLRDGPQMTATEVQERVEQALRFMGPMLGRQDREFLQPIVQRVYAIADRKGLIPEAPPELTNAKVYVRYSSLMAASQRMSEMTNISRFFQALTPLTAVSPQVMDVVHADNGAKHIARLTNLPQEMIRTEEEIQAIREQRAQAQQQQAEAMQGAEDAKSDATVIGAAAKFNKQQA